MLTLNNSVYLGDTISDAILFTLSPSEVGIEVLSTQYTGPIEAWEVRDRNTGDVKCSINITAPLKMCVDESASAGTNSYAIYGVWPGGSWGPKTFAINGLQQDRTFFLNINL